MEFDSIKESGSLFFMCKLKGLIDGNFFVMFKPIVLSVILLIEASESMRDKCLGQPFLQVLSRKLNNSRKVFGRKILVSFIDASPSPRILRVLSDFHSTLISVGSLSSRTASGRISKISDNIRYRNQR